MPPQRRGEPYKSRSMSLARIRRYAVSQLDRFPALKRLILPPVKSIMLLDYRWRAKRIAARHGGAFDTNKTCWIQPGRVAYASQQEFDVYKHEGEIIGGDWDRLATRFEGLDVFIAFKERFVHGKEWRDTDYYRRVLGEIQNGQLKWRCASREELDLRFEGLDKLYAGIREVGYKTQDEVILETNADNPLQHADEVTVNVGRDGDLLFNNGAHRLSIAKLLGLDRIPVRITVRHSQWHSFRNEVLLYARGHAGRIYSPITHPDLEDVPAAHGLESERFGIIEGSLSPREGRLLDIGANWGYFCHKFEELGFECYAVENDSVHVYFLEKLRRAENRRFTIVAESVFEYQGIEQMQFDVVLALNIFHHFLKDKDTYLKLCDLLSRLKVKELYFEPHISSSTQMDGAYQNYSEQDFVAFVQEKSELRNAEFLGRATDGRGMYKLF